MKILIISHEYPPLGGGGANACFFLARQFAQSGNDVDILTAMYEGLPKTEKTETGVKIYRVKCKRKNKEKSSFAEMLSFLCSAWRKAEKMARENHYDKCLTFFGIPSGPIALHLKRKYGLPYVVRFGGGDIPGAQKRFKYVYAVVSPILRTIWREADALIANSEGLKKRAQRFEKRYEISIIENGVDDQFFCPLEEKAEGDILKILFVSRLIEGKGLQFVIPKVKDINAQVAQKGKKGIELLIVGDGPYRTILEKITKENEVEDLVRFEGRKNKDEVREYYRNADLFILPSLSEGMPNVVLEAMATGLPIVMTPCEGSKELINGNGIISKVEEFDKALVEMCISDDKRKIMGQTSRKLVEEHFRWKVSAQKYLFLMNEILKDHE
ncbi:MAG: glycosyltransferase family 4 protein [Lachnospiraceae bacterium]|nr:glycosyltransferase family 4 protein [Lachnospiraceae bacterium]